MQEKEKDKTTEQVDTSAPKTIAEQREEAAAKKIAKVNAPSSLPNAQVQGPSETEKIISNSYDNNIKNMGLLIQGLEGRKANAQQQDETAQRRARSMQTVAGISDGLASLANLIGVAHGGTNIDMGTGALTPLQQKMEAARLERKADIKSIDDRLEQYRNQMLQMQMAKGNALAQQKAKEIETANNRLYEAAKTKDAQKFQEKITKMQIEAAEAGRKEGYKHEAEQNELNRMHQANQNELNRKNQREVTELEIQGRKDLAELNNEADIAKYNIRYGNSKDKNTTQFVMNDPATGAMRTIDIADKSLTNILATYLPMAIKNGEISEEEAESAKNYKSNEVSKTNLLGMVNKSKTMRNALLTAVGETIDNTPVSKEGGAKYDTSYLFQNNSSVYEPGWSTKYDK